jgi:hypothetical protein
METNKFNILNERSDEVRQFIEYEGQGRVTKVVFRYGNKDWNKDFIDKILVYMQIDIDEERMYATYVFHKEGYIDVTYCGRTKIDGKQVSLQDSDEVWKILRSVSDYLMDPSLSTEAPVKPKKKSRKKKSSETTKE